MNELQQTKISDNATYAISKALHHSNAAQFYFDMVITEVKPKRIGKLFLISLRDKAKSIVTSMLSRLKDGETKDKIKSEISDPLLADAIMEIFIRLDEDKRVLLEDYGGFLFDIQLAQKSRTEQGYTAEFNELIATHRNTIDEHIKEREREIGLLKKQREILGV